MRSVITLITGIVAGLVGCASPRATLRFTVAEPSRGAAVAATVSRRLSGYGVAGAHVRVDGASLSVELREPRGAELEPLRTLIAQPGRLRIAEVEVLRPASAVHLEDGALELTLDPEAARQLGATTERSLGAKLPIVVDDEVVASPTLKAPLTAGRVAITLSAAEDRVRLRTLAALFASGPLPSALSPTKD
jgi:preprotein translocase subunit SecD